jgi:hypothetical protein
MALATQVGIVTVVGTAAADTVLLRLRTPRTITIDDATIVSPTGGTAAGPTLLIGKSLAGTGAVENFGTHTFGTDADNTQADIAVTATDLAAGDDIVISVAAGTVASTPLSNLMLSWIDNFNT